MKPEIRLGEIAMAYELEEFCNDCRGAIQSDPGDGGREVIRDKLAELVKNQDFVAEHCWPGRPFGTYTVYQDPETDFHLLAHCFDNGSKSPPHDHGKSWAIYAQTRGYTDMTVWDRNDDPAAGGPVDLSVRETYRLNPGDAGIFHPGDIHTIEFNDGSRFVRVTGTDLNQEAQAIYNRADKTVKIASAAQAIDSESKSRG